MGSAGTKLPSRPVMAAPVIALAMGCRQFQGYLLSPPLEPGQLLGLPGLASEDDTNPAAARA